MLLSKRKPGKEKSVYAAEIQNEGKKQKRARLPVSKEIGR
jgi:hypothetical protein